MATDVQRGKANTFSFVPPTQWASPTARVEDPDGTTVESPTPSVSAVSTTVASASTSFVFTVDDATGISPGTHLEVAGDWGNAVVEVTDVDGTTITTIDPLPDSPEVGATVKGIDVTVTITAITKLGVGYRCVLIQGTQEMVSMFSVVRQPFVFPITTQRIRRYVADYWPSDPLLDEVESLDGIRESAERILRGRLMGTGKYPHLLLDHESLEESALVAMKIALLDRNRIPGGLDYEDYRRSLTFELRDRITDIAAGATPYDLNDDGAVDASEKVKILSIRVGR